MTQESSLERRRHPRTLLQVPIRLSTIDPELDPWTGRPFFRTCEETIADLSRGGARVRSREPLAPGRRLLLELELPDGRSFEAIARVAWARLESGCEARRHRGILRARRRVPRRHSRSRHESRALPAPARHRLCPVARKSARGCGFLIGARGDGYPPAPHAPAGQLQDCEPRPRLRRDARARAAERKARARGSSTPCATRSSKAATACASGAIFTQPTRSVPARDRVARTRLPAHDAARPRSARRTARRRRRARTRSPAIAPAVNGSWTGVRLARSRRAILVPGAGLEPARPEARRF